MTPSHDRKFFDELLDRERVLVVPLKAHPKLRLKIVAEARKLDLRLERAREQVDPYERREITQKARSIRIRQDVRITLDDCETEPDGSFVLRQELKLPAGTDAKPASSFQQPPITQSDRQVWLVGPDAERKAPRLLEALWNVGIEVAWSRVYRLPKNPRSRQRYAVDPWFMTVALNDESECGVLQKELRDLLLIERGQGPWRDARVTKPIDLYELDARFRELAGKRARLSYRGLPMVFPQATAPQDPDYESQKPYLNLINAVGMWGRVEPLVPEGLQSVVVYLVDSGVKSCSEAPVDCGRSVLVDQSVPEWDLGKCTPFTGALHGTQIASVIGATWDIIGMAGVAGIAGDAIKLVSLRCSSLFHIRRALEFAESNIQSTERGVVVIGLDVLVLYFCAVTFPDYFEGEAARFKETLERVTVGKDPKLLVVIPSGNQDRTNPKDPVEIPMPDPPNDLNLGGTIVVGACDGERKRWETLLRASRYSSDHLSLLAPGAGIRSLTGCTPRSYAAGSGTSFAAAHVAGVAALMRAIDRNATPEELKDMITGCCGSSPSPPEQCGSGVLDADAALDAVIP